MAGAGAARNKPRFPRLLLTGHSLLSCYHNNSRFHDGLLHYTFRSLRYFTSPAKGHAKRRYEQVMIEVTFPTPIQVFTEVSLCGCIWLGENSIRVCLLMVRRLLSAASDEFLSHLCH